MIPLTDHPLPDELTAFLGGRLPSSVQSAVAQHIESCDACCQALRAIPDDDLVSKLRDASSVGSGAQEPGPAESTTSLPRELIDHPRYKLGRFLGRGGMGAVYQAEHRLMNRQVALKIIHPELLQHPRVVERFHLEVKAAARLSHPNIVTAFDADQAGTAHFLVMEYVDGMSLARLVGKRGPLEIAYACYFIRQAAKGLHHAWEAGMVHRDIKPHNLMLTRKGQVKILDFGLARFASESRDLAMPTLPDRPGLTRVGDIMGTPEYMAPEQITDPGGADIRADLCSLGCTLYFLLAGQSPFADISSRALLLSPRRRRARPITELRPELPASLIAIIERMMANDPARRYETPAEVVKALAPFARPIATPAPATPPARTAGVAPAPVRVDPGTFPVQCPFCNVNFRVAERLLGASIACPHCRSFLTAVPDATVSH